MAKRIDPRIYNSFVDTNFWDRSEDAAQDAAMREILDLADREEVMLILPFSVKAETEHPNTPREIQRIAAGMIHTVQTQLTRNELEIRVKLLELIQGNAKPGKHDRDVYHLFEAEKYGGGYFITKDNRLLKKSAEVEHLLRSLRIVSPSDFMTYFSSGGLTPPNH
jgi:hypothetical protein